MILIYKKKTLQPLAQSASSKARLADKDSIGSSRCRSQVEEEGKKCEMISSVAEGEVRPFHSCQSGMGALASVGRLQRMSDNSRCGSF